MLHTMADLCKKIDEKANSVREEDIEEVSFLKQEVQNLEEVIWRSRGKDLHKCSWKEKSPRGTFAG